MSYEYSIHMDSMPSSMELKHLFSTEEFIVIDSGSIYLSIARAEYAGQSQKWGGEIHIEWEPGALFVPWRDAYLLPTSSGNGICPGSMP